MGDLNLDVVFSVEEQKEKEKEKAEEEMNGLMRWEKFLPRMILRVLLVEADDSTRQIISALLRKCSYRGLNYEHLSLCFSILCFLQFNRYFSCD